MRNMRTAGFLLWMLLVFSVVCTGVTAETDSAVSAPESVAEEAVSGSGYIPENGVAYYRDSESGYQVFIVDEDGLLLEEEKEACIREMMPAAAYTNVVLELTVGDKIRDKKSRLDNEVKGQETDRILYLLCEKEESGGDAAQKFPYTGLSFRSAALMKDFMPDESTIWSVCPIYHTDLVQLVRNEVVTNCFIKERYGKVCSVREVMVRQGHTLYGITSDPQLMLDEFAKGAEPLLEWGNVIVWCGIRLEEPEDTPQKLLDQFGGSDASLFFYDHRKHSFNIYNTGIFAERISDTDLKGPDFTPAETMHLDMLRGFLANAYDVELRLMRGEMADGPESAAESEQEEAVSAAQIPESGTAETDTPDENVPAARSLSGRNSETGHSVDIEDNAGLLQAGEAEKLQKEMEPFTEYGNLAFVTRDRSGGYQGYISYAQAEAAKLLHGNGALFLIDMKDRKAYFCTAGSTKRVLTNSKCRTITDNVYKLASRGEYYACASVAFRQVLSVMRGERIAQPLRMITSIFLGLLTGLLINFILIRKSREIVDEESSVVIGTPDVFESSDAEITVYKRVSNDSDSGGGGSGGGGGGGGSFGGGGHSF